MIQQNKLTPDELLILRADIEKINDICVPHPDMLKPTLEISDKERYFIQLVIIIFQKSPKDTLSY